MADKTYLKTTLAIFAMLFLLTQLTFAAPPRYDVIDLGTLGGRKSWAWAINDAGQVVGDSTIAGGGTHAFRWDSSNGMIDLGTLGGPRSDAIGINNAGQVVGNSRTAVGENHAFLWDKTDGMIDLGTLGSSSYARDINDAGQVVGSSGSHAFLWDSINGMRDLGTLAHSSWSEAYGINGCGQVVGISGDHVFLWEDGEMTDLGTLGGSRSRAFGINDAGQVVGDSTTTGERHAFIWDSTNGMVDLGTLGGNESYAYRINDAGQVVGGSNTAAGDWYAFIWDSTTGMLNLNDLLSANSGWRVLKEAKDINNRGQIVGYGYTDSGEYRAFLMTPVLPTIYYVDADATGANDGSSWADAFNYLQDALAAAWNGDEICVAQGIYKPDQGAGITPGDRAATFQLKNGVTLKGGYAGFGHPDPNARDIELYETILTGDLNGDDAAVDHPEDLLEEPTRAENSCHVVTGSGTDPTAILSGFTITAGNANIRGFFQNKGDGGGIYNENGSPMLISICCGN